MPRVKRGVMTHKRHKKVIGQASGYFGAKKLGADCYPDSLDVLVEGKTLANDPNGVKMKFLRRIPVDPTTGSDEWGLRGYQDKPDSTSWSGQNVYDVYSKNQGTGLDGTKYRDWN